ncbi:MAG: hypothetical protein ACTSX8_08555, partial [Alphaproteobacteria bacterium]
MSAKGCILKKAKAGRVNKDKAARLVELFDELEVEARGTVGPNEAQALAAKQAEIALARQTKAKARRTLKQMQAQSEILARSKAVPGAESKAMLSVLDFDPSGKHSGPNVAIQTQVVRGRAQAIMVDFIEKFRSKSAGFRRRKAGSRAIVRELFGEASGDQEAKALASGIRGGMEYLRTSFNAAGGDIPQRVDWGLPQFHNRRTVAAAEKSVWVDDVIGGLDRQKMLDHDTGLAFGDSKLRRTLADTYDGIVSDGMSELRPGGFTKPGLVNRRQQSRFLTFKSADAWLDYQTKYGEGDVFNIVTGHIEGMSRDVALLQVMGPSPEATLRLMENIVSQARAKVAIEGTGNKAARAAARIGTGGASLRNVYAVVSGQSQRIGGNATAANVGAANRNVLVSAMLGGAFFSALSDRTFANITARMNGITPVKTLARHLKLMSPTSVADQKLAVRLGYGAQGWASQAIAAQRYVGEFIGPQWSQAIADTTLRLSLLSPWTQAGRWSFGTEFSGFITDQIAKKFSALPEPLRRSFERHGITAADWELMRATPLWRDAETGAEFLRPQDMIGSLDPAQADTPLFKRHQDAANKLQSMILTESEFAVPSGTATSKAFLLGGTQPGTFIGEMLRNTAMFKSFPVTLVQTHLQRAVHQQGGLAKGKYVAQLVIGTAVLGALGEQLSQISKGKDPLPFDKRLWQKAMLRGGGLGIFGDFLFSDVNRFGGGIAQTLLGPVLGTQLPQAVKLTIGNIQQLLAGEDTKAGRELVRFVKLMAPGRSLWYSALATERLIFDELQKMLDPDAARSFKRIEDRMRRETGQRF